MPCYIVQIIECGPLTGIEYFKRKVSGRPSDEDKRQFTKKACDHFARRRDVQLSEVVPGKMTLCYRKLFSPKAIELED
jgi:hypothetical protein